MTDENFSGIQQIGCYNCNSLKQFILGFVEGGILLYCEACGIISFLPLDIKYQEQEEIKTKPTRKVSYAG